REGDPQCGPLRKVLQRPHHRRVRAGHLGREAVPGGLNTSIVQPCDVRRNAMNWEQRYRLKHAARTSLVLWASLSLVAALVCAPAVRWLDQETGWGLFRYTPD